MQTTMQESKKQRAFKAWTNQARRKTGNKGTIKVVQPRLNIRTMCRHNDKSAVVGTVPAFQKCHYQ